MNSPSSASAPTRYALSSDLARLCLPAATRDANRKLAYVNSICILFLSVGLVGLKMPEPFVRPLPEVTEFVPILFTPPEQQPETQTQEVPEEPPEDLPEISLDTPVVATVVAADASAVAFAVPVQGPVILAPARFAAAPPRVTRAPPPQPTRFVPTGREAGNYPWPREYPRRAAIEGRQGTVMMLVVVGADGAPASVTIHESSGHPDLDRHAIGWLSDKWRWPPGPERRYHVPFVYQLPK